jgi:hypothetical protein
MKTLRLRRFGVLSVVSLAVACGGSSNSQVPDVDGGGNNPGLDGSLPPGSDGSLPPPPGDGAIVIPFDAGYDGATCPPMAAMTVAANIDIKVTWPATTAGNGGTGDVHVWLLSKFTANGNQFTGTSQTCGLSLPDLTLNGLGSIAAGGSKVQIQIPPGVWAAPSMPSYMSTGSQMGWSPPSTFRIDPTLALIGLTLPGGTDPTSYAWPTSSWSFPTGTTFPDHDGDSNPGITASPLMGNGYVLPPTAIGLGGSAPAADQVYLATRTRVSLNGQWTTCTDLAGNATVMSFDNHVVGCRIKGGTACTTGAANTQADFLDQNRTVYVPGAATFVAKTLAANGTCADALAALP